MGFIDVHAHLDRYPEDELPAIISNAKSAGVSIIVSSGIDNCSNRKVLEICKKYDIVKASLGLYPPDALMEEKETDALPDLDEELAFIEKNRNHIVSIGEIGLDYFNGKDKDLQKKFFIELLNLAKKIDKPVIIHSRKAESDALDILESMQMKKVVLHCFSGKKSLIKRAADLGYYFSIPTNIVRAQNFQDLVKNVNINQLLTETDSPFLSPFKDRRNEPAFVVESAKKIAEIKGFELKEVENNILMNYKNMFG